jgi:hypothetical protein
MNVPFYLVVQPDQYLKYAAVVNSKKILVLPKPWWKPGEGLVHTRNWIWEHAKQSGVKRFWQIDDNIKYFFRLNDHMKIPVCDGTIFRCAEDFTDRFNNVAQSGLQYFYFASRKSAMPPFTLNTRIYSCTLNLTSLPHRYELMYNDDTDLSIRVLKDGYSTILFNAFLQGKAPTLMTKGGNAAIYRKEIDGRKKMAEALAKKFPDIVKVVQKWNRHQHQVDYSGFKNNDPQLKPNLKFKGIDNYGIELINLKSYTSIFQL